MSQIKLVVVDIGGSLIDDNNNISDKNIEMFKLLKSKGILIGLITARMYSSTKYISNQISCDYGIFGNGSILISLKNKQVIYSNTIPYFEKKELIKYGKNNNLYIHFSQFFHEGSDINDYFLLKHMILNERYPLKLKSNIIKVDNLNDYVLDNDDIVNIIFVSEQSMDEIYKDVKRKFQNIYISEYNKSSFESTINKTINYIEICNKPTNKSSGLDTLIKHLNLNKEEVLVIGDGDNDIEMFKNYPNSGCLSNGSENAKKYANYISSATNNESGVSEIIKYYMKRGRL